MAVVKGTKDLSRKRAAKVLKATGGTDKIRCPGCHELAVAVPNGLGGVKHRCIGCHREFVFQKL